MKEKVNESEGKIKDQHKNHFYLFSFFLPVPRVFNSFAFLRPTKLMAKICENIDLVASPSFNFFSYFFCLFINQISVYIYKYFVVIIIVESTWVWRAKVPELSTPHLPPLPRTEEQIRKRCVRK